jgi:ATP-binding cassette subfamily C protein
MTRAPHQADPSSALSEALRACRGAFTGVGLMSGMINILYLTGSFFMLEVYDRVVPSRSIPTLVGLCVLALALYAFQGILDLLRARVLSRIGASLDESLSDRVYDTLVRRSLRMPANADGLQPMRDLDQVRGFLSGLGPAAMFDLPWMPLYVGLCFLFHPLIGVTALFGALILVILTIMTDVMTRGPTRDAVQHGGARNALAESSRRNAEVIQAMGMSGRMTARWNEANAKYQDSQQRASDVTGGIGAVSKVFRTVLQSAVLAVGAYLVIQQLASPGIMIASSILVARALAPVELAIANWRGFVGARQSWRRLRELLAHFPATETPMALPAPRKSISVESLAVVPPGDRRVVVQDATFQLQAGQGLGVIGPSASGKSSLARAVVGVWVPARGKIRLDGAALEQWDRDDLGRHIGYVPQDVELFAGTVAQNIARFEAEPDAAAVIKAAEEAGVHELILRLPDGYETQIGEGGASLSAGQRQRVALARALYRDPFLLVLDEPNSNLDGEGEQALTRAILSVRQRGGVVIVVAHRPSALAGVDMVLAMGDGRVQAFGPRDEVLAKVLRPAPAAGIGAPAAARAVAAQGAQGQAAPGQGAPGPGGQGPAAGQQGAGQGTGSLRVVGENQGAAQ